MLGKLILQRNLASQLAQAHPELGIAAGELINPEKIQELLKAGDLDEESRLIYEKLVTRSLFGNINASRNSA